MIELCFLEVADHEFSGFFLADDGRDFVGWRDGEGGAEDEAEIAFFGVGVGEIEDGF